MQEERELTAGKGSTAHFVWRCGLCKRESSAKFEPNEKPKPYTAEANGQFAPFLTVDCRGLEFVGFDPKVRTYARLDPEWYIDVILTGNLEVRGSGVWDPVQ